MVIQRGRVQRPGPRNVERNSGGEGGLDSQRGGFRVQHDDLCAATCHRVRNPAKTVHAGRRNDRHQGLIKGSCRRRKLGCRRPHTSSNADSAACASGGSSYERRRAMVMMWVLASRPPPGKRPSESMIHKRPALAEGRAAVRCRARPGGSLRPRHRASTDSASATLWPPLWPPRRCRRSSWRPGFQNSRRPRTTAAARPG